MPALGGMRRDAVAVHYAIEPRPTAEVEYSLALIVIGVGGAVIGSAVWLARLIVGWLLRKYHIETTNR